MDKVIVSYKIHLQSTIASESSPLSHGSGQTYQNSDQNFQILLISLFDLFQHLQGGCRHQLQYLLPPPVLSFLVVPSKRMPWVERCGQSTEVRLPRARVSGFRISSEGKIEGQELGGI